MINRDEALLQEAYHKVNHYTDGRDKDIIFKDKNKNGQYEWTYRGHTITVDIDRNEETQDYWYEVTKPSGERVRPTHISTYEDDTSVVERWIDDGCPQSS